MDLPGKAEAESLGYSLFSASSTAAQYIKGDLFLRINKNGEAVLYTTYKMVKLEIGPFALPNKNFELFERTMGECLS